jgi:hypothetical protein
MPKCAECGKVKPEKDFPVRSRRNGIVTIKNPCNTCEAARKYGARHKEETDGQQLAR